MKRRLLELLACPSCRERVTLQGAPSEEDDVTSGSLRCDGCGSCYPLVKGIPRMIPAAEGTDTSHSFESEFTMMSSDDLDMDPYEVRRFYFFSRTGIDPKFYEHFHDPYITALRPTSYEPDPSFLRGKIVLDAGCGPARFTEVAAREGAGYVVGLELGDHVERAAQRCAALDNTDFVQGSVLSPPFRLDVFDYAFSIGVLHHTSDPYRGFQDLSACIKPGGAISVMLYAADYWGDRLRGAIARSIHRKMSKLPPERALRVTTRWLYPLGRLQMKIAASRVLKWLSAPLFLITVPRHPKREVMIATILDYYTPTHISIHKAETIAGWAAEAGFREIHKLPVAASLFATRRRA